MLAGNQTETTVRFGLRAKFVTAFAGATVLVVLLILALQELMTRRAMITQTVEQGEAIAKTIEATAGYYVIFGLTDDLESIVGDLSRSPSIEYADFVDGSGKVLAATSATIPPGLVNRPLARETGASAGERMHIYAVPFWENKGDAANPAIKPKGYFRLVMNETQAEEAIASQRRWSVLILLLSIITASALAWLASRLIVQPILALVETARIIAKGDLTQRAQ